MEDLSRLYYEPSLPDSLGGTRQLYRSAGAKSSKDKARVDDWLSG